MIFTKDHWKDMEVTVDVKSGDHLVMTHSIPEAIKQMVVNMKVGFVSRCDTDAHALFAFDSYYPDDNFYCIIFDNNFENVKEYHKFRRDTRLAYPVILNCGLKTRAGNEVRNLKTIEIQQVKVQVPVKPGDTLVSNTGEEYRVVFVASDSSLLMQDSGGNSVLLTPRDTALMESLGLNLTDPNNLDA